MSKDIAYLKVRFGGDTVEFHKKMKEMEYAVKGKAKQFSKLGDGLLKMAAPMAAVGAIGVKLAADFDDSMRKVQAVSGATGEQFDALKKKAMEMGRDTKFSASQSAEAMNYMGMAGWDTQQIMKGLPGVLSLAAASGTDLATTSDIVTDALTAFKLQAQDTGMFVDVMAAASSAANTNVQMMGETFKQIAPLAGAAGYSIQDTALAIGLMANSGVKAERAGTALKNMVTNLTKPTSEMAKSMNQLGIEMTNTDGTIKPLGELLNNLRDKFGGLTDAEKLHHATTIAGKEGLSGFMALIEASPDDFEKLSNSIVNSTGKAKEMADIMEGGIGGAFRSLKSAAEAAGIEIGEAFAPYVKYAAEALRDLAKWFSELSPAWKNAIVATTLLTLAMGGTFKVIGLLIGGIGGLATWIGTLAKVMKSAKLAQIALNLAMYANPIGLIIAGVAAITALVVVAIKKWDSWGAALLMFMGPVGYIINGFKNIYNHWDSIKKAFKTDGILGGLKRIKDVLVDSMLVPLRQILKLATSLPYVGKYALQALDGIDRLQNKMGTAKSKVNIKDPLGVFGLKDIAKEVTDWNKGRQKTDDNSDDDNTDTPKLPPIKPVLDENEKAAKKSAYVIAAALIEPSKLIADAYVKNQARIAEENDKVKQGIDSLAERSKKSIDNGVTAHLTKMTNASKAAQNVLGEIGSTMEKTMGISESLGIAFQRIADKISSNFLEMVETITPVIDQLSNTLGSYFDYKDARIQQSYDAERQTIENSKSNEEQKAAAIKALDEKTAKERRRLMLKEAIANKAFAIFNAAISVAQGVAKALSLGPIGIPLAAVIGALGAVQMGFIAAKPLPKLAKGGILRGESAIIAGDNPNAKVDPEVVSPLSKLKGMIGDVKGKDMKITITLESFKTLINGRDLVLLMERNQNVTFRTT